MIKFVYFDLGGVLFAWEHSLQAIAQISGKNLEDVKKVFVDYDEKVCVGQLDPDALWKLYYPEGENIDFVDFWTDQFVPYSTMHLLVNKISNDYGVGFLTNCYPRVYSMSQKKKKVPIVTNSICVNSCEVGYQKPSREIFEIAQNQCGHTSDEILLIDDNRANVEAARLVGWNAYQFKTEAEAIRDLKDIVPLSQELF